MRWFQHDCDMHTDLKIQSLIEKHRADGYLVWCLCLELVGKEGQRGILNSKSGWQNGLLKVTSWLSEGQLQEILKSISELGLINSKSFKYGNLYIPKFMKRSDNWSKRLLGSNSVVTTAIDNTILDKIRREYIALKNLDIKNFCSDDYARTGRAIKILVGKAKGNDQLVIEALRWAKEQKWCDWTLETVSRRWVDFMAYKENKPRSRPL